jgi:LuxR family maltose regulon positive regulatory protein
MAGNTHLAISGAFIQADIRVAQGCLHEAVSAYESSLQLAAEQGEPVPLVTADLYMGLSMLHLEQGDPEAAAQYLLKSKSRYRICSFAGALFRPEYRKSREI